MRQLILHNELDNLLGSGDYGLINQQWLAFIKICGISPVMNYYEFECIYTIFGPILIIHYVRMSFWQECYHYSLKLKKWKAKRRIGLSACHGCLLWSVLMLGMWDAIAELLWWSTAHGDGTGPSQELSGSGNMDVGRECGRWLTRHFYP